MHQTGFSDMAWGKDTHGYATLAHSLANTKFDAIIQEAQEFMKLIQSCSKTTEPTEIIDINDCDACLINNSDSDVECKSSLLFHDITDIDHSESMMWLTVPHNPTINFPSCSCFPICACLSPCQILLWLIMLTLLFMDPSIS
jgi:hypothetical protein